MGCLLGSGLPCSTLHLLPEAGIFSLSHHRLQVSLGVVEMTKDPEEAQLPEGLQQNQGKGEERKNG